MRIVVFGLLALGCGVSEGGLFGTEGDAGSGGASSDAGIATGGVAFHPDGSGGSGGRSAGGATIGSGGFSLPGTSGTIDLSQCPGPIAPSPCAQVDGDSFDCEKLCPAYAHGACSPNGCDDATARYYSDKAGCETQDPDKVSFTLKMTPGVGLHLCDAQSSSFVGTHGYVRCCCLGC